MQNRNNEGFHSDDFLEATTLLTWLEPGAHLDIPAKLPGVGLKREKIADDLDTIDSDTDHINTYPNG